MGAVKRQATINPDYYIWKSLEGTLSKMYCAYLAEDYVTQGEDKLKACVNKMQRPVAKAKAVRAKLVPCRRPYLKAYLSRSHP
jgi:hypothetical protein